MTMNLDIPTQYNTYNNNKKKTIIILTGYGLRSQHNQTQYDDTAFLTPAKGMKVVGKTGNVYRFCGQDI